MSHVGLSGYETSDPEVLGMEDLLSSPMFNQDYA